MSSVTKRLASAAVLARNASAAITRCISTTAGRGVRLLRDLEPRLRRYRSSFAVSLASLLQPTPAAGRRRARGLRKLSPDFISKATDETAAQVTRIALTFLGTTAFCLLSPLSQDSALLGGRPEFNPEAIGYSVRQCRHQAA
jgi:hypothetical protein